MRIRLCTSRIIGMNGIDLFEMLAVKPVAIILILELNTITIRSKFDKSKYIDLSYYQNKIKLIKFLLRLNVGSQIKMSFQRLRCY